MGDILRAKGPLAVTTRTWWAAAIMLLFVSGCAMTVGSPVPDERSENSDMGNY